MKSVSLHGRIPGGSFQNMNKNDWFHVEKAGACFAFNLFIMLSRRDILIQLRTMGVKEQSLLKEYLRDFERYMKENYGLEVIKKKEGKKKTTSP